jgi:hypothetical protein
VSRKAERVFGGAIQQCFGFVLGPIFVYGDLSSRSPRLYFAGRSVPGVEFRGALYA